MIELLSPAGNRERLEYALAYGADAVYMAGSRYSLRAFADNFEPDELKSALELVHSKGKKAYITVNIYAHNSDIDGMEDYYLMDGGIITVNTDTAAMIGKQAEYSCFDSMGTVVEVTTTKD